MDSVTTIVFTDIAFKELGTVTFDGTTLTFSNEYVKEMARHYLDRGMSSQQWVAKFSSWDNGHIFSEAI